MTTYLEVTMYEPYSSNVLVVTVNAQRLFSSDPPFPLSVDPSLSLVA